MYLWTNPVLNRVNCLLQNVDHNFRHFQKPYLPTASATCNITKIGMLAFYSKYILENASLK